MTRGRLHTGGRSTSVVAAATSTLIGLTSYHLRERNVMNSRFVGSTAKIPEECPMIFLFFPLIFFFFFFSIYRQSTTTFYQPCSNTSVAFFLFLTAYPGFLDGRMALERIFVFFGYVFYICDIRRTVQV